MPYLALYRKYRPQTFSEVSAQPHITKTLAAQVASESVSHAYLFTGTRGTGKTTCAKILAKAVNCLTPVGGEPCGTCGICTDIEAGRVTDVMEMDAASNSGVDNIRDLRDNAVYLPSRCKKRVFIIDECHMLSGGAWNALLKIIEDPPAHVMFIFATTEPSKVPATIASRCQRFDFHQIGESDIAARLQIIAEAEGINLTPDAATLIGRIADGALRDAISLLDTCVAATTNGEQITTETVAAAAGLANREYLSEFADYIIEGNATEAIALCDNLYRNSKSLDILTTELAEYFRNLMVIKATNGKSANLIIVTEKEQTELARQATFLDINKIIEILKLLSDTLSCMGRTGNKRLEFEIFLIKAIYGDTSPVANSSNIAQTGRIAWGTLEPSALRQKERSPDSDSSRASLAMRNASEQGAPPVTPTAESPAIVPVPQSQQQLPYLADTSIQEKDGVITITVKTKFKADFIQNKLSEVQTHFGKRVVITVDNAASNAVERVEPKSPDMLGDFLAAASTANNEQ